MRLRFPNGLFDLHAATAVLTAGMAFPTERTGYIRIRAAAVGEVLLPVATLVEGESAATVSLAPGVTYRIRANRLDSDLIEDGTIHVETLVELSQGGLVVHLPRIEELHAVASEQSLHVEFRIELLDGQTEPEQIELFTSTGEPIDTESLGGILAWTGPGDYEASLPAASAVTLAARAIHASGPGELMILSLANPAASPQPPTLLPEVIA